MLASRIKIYQDTQRYETYEIETISGKHYVKKIYNKGSGSKRLKIIGKADSFEDAIAIAHFDAQNHGNIYKVERE